MLHGLLSGQRAGQRENPDHQQVSGAMGFGHVSLLDDMNGIVSRLSVRGPEVLNSVPGMLNQGCLAAATVPRAHRRRSNRGGGWRLQR
jgi:hypothetical protein